MAPNTQRKGTERANVSKRVQFELATIAEHGHATTVRTHAAAERAEAERRDKRGTKPTTGRRQEAVNKDAEYRRDDRGGSLLASARLAKPLLLFRDAVLYIVTRPRLAAAGAGGPFTRIT